MRPYRIGIRSGTRALACSSRTVTGSGRSAGGAHRAWLDRDAELRRSRPLARHSSGVSTSCGGARTPGLILLTRAPPPILARRMLSAKSAKARGHLKASAPSKLYGQAAITHSADGYGDTGWPEVPTHLQAGSGSASRYWPRIHRRARFQPLAPQLGECGPLGFGSQVASSSQSQVARTEENAINQLGDLRPRSSTVLRRCKAQPVPHASRIFLRLAGGRYGDFRDGPAIEGWALVIAGQLDGAATMADAAKMRLEEEDENRNYPGSAS